PSSPSLTRPPPRATLFPYTTLFRSHPAANHATADDQEGASHPDAAGEGSVEDGAGDFPHRRVHPYGLYCERRTASPWDAVLWQPDRKSTRLNSSHVKISYAVFCLKK